jgi:hypothetical protein
VLQQSLIHQPVVDNYVRLLEAGQPLDGDEAGVARAGSYQIDDSVAATGSQAVGRRFFTPA